MTDDSAVRSIQARTCEVPSEKYKGLCMKRHNCVEICQSEGYSYGRCSKILRCCICLKPCNWCIGTLIVRTNNLQRKKSPPLGKKKKCYGLKGIYIYIYVYIYEVKLNNVTKMFLFSWTLWTYCWENFKVKTIIKIGPFHVESSAKSGNPKNPKSSWLVFKVIELQSWWVPLKVAHLSLFWKLMGCVQNAFVRYLGTTTIFLKLIVLD